LSRTPLNELLPDSSRGATAGRSHARLRHALLVVQVTMSIVLVLGAGLLTRSLLELTRIDLGFQTANVLTAQVQLPTSSYPDAESVVRFYRVLEERLQQIPGVQSAGAVRILPLSRRIGDWSITIEGIIPTIRHNAVVEGGPRRDVSVVRAARAGDRQLGPDR
jgi:putative ABC transport system permease protein